MTDINEKLNKVSKTMCAAKWLQSSLHLHIGHTHSCHHPRTHKIPLKEIEASPDALHNTSYKKEQRKKMIYGGRPAECQYCWNIEDLGKESDRHHKSNELWTNEKLEWNKNVTPKYLEISFSNVCNFKCSYCSPQFSSKWMEEINEYGHYYTSNQFNNIQWLKNEEKMPIKHREDNPYIDAFWKWWPDIKENTEIIRITGGEPLLSNNTLKLLKESLGENNLKSIGINSNLCVPEKIFNNFLDLIKEAEKEKEIILYASVDTWGEQAEYIRNGLNFSNFTKNAKKILDETKKTKFSFMITYNCLSPFDFNTLLDFIATLKNCYPNRVLLDTPYLRNPIHQNPKIINQYFRKKILFNLETMKNLNVFSEKEIFKFDKTIKYAISEEYEFDLKTAKKDFWIFFTEHDRRRNTNLLKVFPELIDFYKDCENGF